MKKYSGLTFLLPSLLMGFDACVSENLAFPEENICQVSSFSIVFKSSDQESLEKNETIEIDGQPIQVGTMASSVYQFDAQNRLIEYRYQVGGLRPGSGSETYEYYPHTLIKKKVSSVGEKTEWTYTLNAQGLVEDSGIKYNTEGFRVEENNEYVRTTYTIENSNIVQKEVKTVAENKLLEISHYTYDLSKPNLPNTAPFQGKISRNLPIHQTSIFYDSAGNPVSYRYDFSYRFDEIGKPTQRYSVFKEGSISSYSISDYSITCQ